MPTAQTETGKLPLRVSMPFEDRPHTVLIFDAQNRLVASSSWHNDSPHYPTKEQAVQNFKDLAEAVNERAALLSLIEEMAGELRRSSEHLKCFSDYHPEESTCDIAASLHCSRAILSSYTAFKEGRNG